MTFNRRLANNTVRTVRGKMTRNANVIDKALHKRKVHQIYL